MKSNLKLIYDKKDKIDILNRQNYLLMPNPIYKVNKFINEINPNYTKNFINNLTDLKIEKESYCDSYYIYDENILYCNNSKGDIFGLLHVASNDRNKKNTGIIVGNEVGFSLNNGLTEVYQNYIEDKKISYKLEAIIAEALLMLDFDLVTYSYFNNAGEMLNEFNEDINSLMNYLDDYHLKSFELINLYKEFFVKKLNKFKTRNALLQLDNLYEKIEKVENSNIENVYRVFYTLIRIINNSKVDEIRKQQIFIKLNYKFKTLFESNEEFNYLKGLNTEFEKNIYLKENEKVKRLVK